MSAIAGVVAPVFALVLLGAAAERWRWLDAAGFRGLHGATFYAGIPALLFLALAEGGELRLLDGAPTRFEALLPRAAVPAGR